MRVRCTRPPSLALSHHAGQRAKETGGVQLGNPAGGPLLLLSVAAHLLNGERVLRPL